MLATACKTVAQEPNLFGAPLSRRRIFLILIRQDVIKEDLSGKDLGTHLNRVLGHLRQPVTKRWFHAQQSEFFACSAQARPPLAKEPQGGGEREDAQT